MVVMSNVIWIFTLSSAQGNKNSAPRNNIPTDLCCLFLTPNHFHARVSAMMVWKKAYFKCCKITVLHHPANSSLLTSCGGNISVGLDSCLTQTHHPTICREKPVGQLYPSSVQLLVGWQLRTDAIRTWALGTDSDTAMQRGKWRTRLLITTIN